MHRSIRILSVLLLLVLASAVRGQTPPTCGVVDVDGPSEVEVGTPLVFKAKIAGLTYTTKPEFKWTVSAGTIMAGQGTNEITVDTTGISGFVVTVTAGLSEVPPGCSGSASRTTNISAPELVRGRLYDEYGDITFEDEKARLKNLSMQLASEPLTTGHILMSAGQETFEKEAEERLARAKSYLVNVREIDPDRIVTFDCGFAKELVIQLYVVPVGATFPQCSNPTQVPLSEVKFTKPRPKSSKQRR